jgi:hypothetical protein
MDPYLENPGLWPDVHARLIAVIGEVLGAMLRPKYIVRIEERVYLSDDTDSSLGVLAPDVSVAISPKDRTRGKGVAGQLPVAVAEPIVELTLIDEEISECFLKVIDREDRAVIAVIEVLSPTNKVAGSRGLASFVQKRREIMNSQAHWVEIDLLRGGVSPGFRRSHEPHEYMVHISPVSLRPRGLLWPIRLSQALPMIRIPLRSEDEDAPLDLQGVLNTVYDRAGYDLEIDYRAEPHPPLGPAWSSWADGLLKRKGMRAS